MKVPVSQNRAQVKSFQVQTNKVATLDKGIVANNVMEANQRLAQSFSDVSKSAGEYFYKQELIERKKNLMKATEEAEKELDDELYSPDVDENQTPKGILNRQLDSAKDSTPLFDEKSKAIADKYASRFDNDEDRAAFASSIGTRIQSSRNAVARHEAGQRQASFDIQIKTSNDGRINRAASLTDPVELMAEVNNATKDYDSNLTLKGYSAEARGMESRKLADQMIATNINAYLEKDPAKAKETLEIFKDKISPEFYQKTLQMVEGKNFDFNRLNLWENKYKNFRLGDGNIDLARVQKDINSGNYTPDEKLKLNSFMEAQAGNLRQQKSQQESAALDSFHNQLVAAKKNGLPLNEALKLSSLGTDRYQQSQMEDAVNKFYSSSIKTSPDTYMRFYEGVKDGSIQKEQIDKARADGILSVDDWTEFRKSLFNSELTGEAGNKGFDRIKLLADENFSASKKDEKNTFLYEMKQATKGMTPEQASSYAKEALKDIVTSKGTLWDTKKPKYQVDFEKRDANSEAWGMIQNDIGTKELQAIGQGIQLKTSKKDLGLSDLDNFASQLGGYEAIKAGTPAHNAIQSLMKKGLRVTPDNIKYVLKRYPEGNY